jgi:hypothetical protein
MSLITTRPREISAKVIPMRLIMGAAGRRPANMS